MAWRTATGKILLALAGTVGVALVVFVVVPWLQAPPPPASPASPEEIIEEVLASPGDEDGEAADEAGDAVAGVLPVARKRVAGARACCATGRGRRRGSRGCRCASGAAYSGRGGRCDVGSVCILTRKAETKRL